MRPKFYHNDSQCRHDVKEIKKVVMELQSDLEGSKLREVCGWLEQTNPTVDHKNARELREVETSRWIGRDDGFKKWLAATHRFLWIHGIPGAGKTILLSHVIEQTQAFCDQLTGANAYIYYYCSFRCTGDEVSSCLRWVVSQLCRQLQ
ncbi:hypothetical protein BDV95DRAFT_180759 [Massariosphaeria phaeospora]|uniref:Nephrocystin 3-like N-terminal domain-containing protein n=1 Tax=Massariosphaeria phaeospora TaxID=100035 RepID=A0A7C8I0L6_9PLEO|nr:hypothetical protein BDV95DRAFT_180759 [Massariosphaeria phaeospora]